eukprot:TRINITY_DN23890_c0_g1_i1.p1 TRINITY_DN23890_c0_g1~~TRINITY_DN23890_c0_g1_i1.p1  ORF type:complete len:697 (-),score=123.13 TRINITY_DN23890_c0_g1_i1:230-2272(-)
MGFTEAIEKEAKASYRPYYLNYADLKELVIQLADEAEKPRSRLMSADIMDDTGQRPITRFQETLRAELKKVNQFACSQHEYVFLGLRKLCDKCRKLAKTDVEPMRQSIRDMGEEIVALDMYVRLNYIGFQKLTEQFDVLLGVSGSALFVSGLHCEPFCNIRFDDLLILLGLAWARLRTAEVAAEQSKDATWVPPESFIRNTSKYWVRPDKVTLLKTRIVEHLPYLIFGASQTEQEKLLEPFALLDLDYEGMSLNDSSAECAYSGAMEESQLLSSVYFDSPDAVCYQERIRREEGARLVRFRWYGENKWEDDKEIFVERKIHHEGWGGKKSAKERSIIPQKDIFQFMKGEFDIDGYFAKLAAEGMFSEKARKNMKAIAVEVDQMIKSKRLQPIIRTSYYRCAFQLATDNKVRISLDTQMSLLNEFVDSGHPNLPWCHMGSAPLTKDDIYRFPYAILEIKLQDVSDTPQWLKETLNEIGAIQVHKFSKFQHAMAFLHPSRVPILPHWHEDFQDWHNKKDRSISMRFKNRPHRDMASVLRSMSFAEDLTVPDPRKMIAPTGAGHFLKDMDNLDPKAVFANERTLLHYAEKGMYSGALAVLLLNDDTHWVKVMGGGLAMATAIFYLWILKAYFDRLQDIVGRSKVGKNSMARLDWQAGPVLGGALVLIVLLLTLAKGLLRKKHD